MLSEALGGRSEQNEGYSVSKLKEICSRLPSHFFEGSGEFRCSGWARFNAGEETERNGDVLDGPGFMRKPNLCLPLHVMLPMSIRRPGCSTLFSYGDSVAHQSRAHYLILSMTLAPDHYDTAKAARQHLKDKRSVFPALLRRNRRETHNPARPAPPTRTSTFTLSTIILKAPQVPERHRTTDYAWAVVYENQRG